jgi:hypothetical protein
MVGRPGRTPVVKLLGDEFTTKIPRSTGSFVVLVLPSGIDLSGAALRHLAGLLAARRRAVGTRWHGLPVGRQALLVLAHLRRGHTCTPSLPGSC